jgi:hypothetical protein
MAPRERREREEPPEPLPLGFLRRAARRLWAAPTRDSGRCIALSPGSAYLFPITGNYQERRWLRDRSRSRLNTGSGYTCRDHTRPAQPLPRLRKRATCAVRVDGNQSCGARMPSPSAWDWKPRDLQMARPFSRRWAAARRRNRTAGSMRHWVLQFGTMG